MSDKILPFDGYRKRRPKDDPCFVSFIGSPFLDGRVQRTLRITFETTGNNVKELIATAQEDGGVWSDEDSVSSVFLPWPCEAVLVRYIQAKT